MVEEEKQRRLVAEAWCRMGQGEKEQSDEGGGGEMRADFSFFPSVLVTVTFLVLRPSKKPSSSLSLYFSLDNRFSLSPLACATRRTRESPSRSPAPPVERASRTSLGFLSREDSQRGIESDKRNKRRKSVTPSKSTLALAEEPGASPLRSFSSSRWAPI